MSATATSTFTTTLVGPPAVNPTVKGVSISEKQCPMCWRDGFPSETGAQDRIQELEGQVHALTERASSTGKLQNYNEPS